jgi:alpha-1,6-mannosyltransferase
MASAYASARHWLSGRSVPSWLSSRRTVVLALCLLCLTYGFLATFPAVQGSPLIHATDGGSPDWLLGPLRFAGAGLAREDAGGPLFYSGMWLCLVLYVTVLLNAKRLPARWAVTVVVALHVLFVLAPPLLSRDVFSYLAYARLDAEHGLNPYSFAPSDVPTDPAFRFTGGNSAISAYGPLFTLLTYPLAGLGLPAAVWSFKALMGLASLGVVLIVWRTARALGRDPLLPALAVGLNPHVLVNVVGGAHNDALAVLVTMLGVLLFVRGRLLAAPAIATVAAGLKGSAVLVVPFLIVGSPPGRVAERAAPERPRRALRGVATPLLAAASAVAAIAIVSSAVFGGAFLKTSTLIGASQGATTGWSAPVKAAGVLGAILPGDTADYTTGTRLAFLVAFATAAIWLVMRARRGADAITMAAWATLAALLATAWIWPWYLLWLLPLAALASDRRPLIAAIALSAWLLPRGIPHIDVPLTFL